MSYCYVQNFWTVVEGTVGFFLIEKFLNGNR